VHPISYFQGAVLGALQGIAEPFPISSLGHGVVFPRLLGWNIHQNDDYFLAFLVATHVATALVLLFIFRDDWKRIVRGLGRSLQAREIAPDDTDARLGWLLVVGTIPAGTLGLLLEHPLRSLFASSASAAAFLIVNGVLLLVFERLRRRPARPGDYLGDSDARIAKLTWRQAFGVGTAQAAALVPGISRSGITMGGGLLFGLSNEDAARYAFLLATPIIGATTYVAVKFLLRFFQSNTLTPLGIYCIAFGVFCTLVFAL
jgi:undecaprenyl-diphosphatase